MYTKQTLQVRWRSITPSQSTASNGVKYEAINSLLSVYFKNSGVGCHMGDDCIGFADDITLLILARTRNQGFNRDMRTYDV